jgi:hypothetical protein
MAGELTKPQADAVAFINELWWEVDAARLSDAVGLLAGELGVEEAALRIWAERRRAYESGGGEPCRT